MQLVGFVELKKIKRKTTFKGSLLTLFQFFFHSLSCSILVYRIHLGQWQEEKKLSYRYISISRKGDGVQGEIKTKTTIAGAYFFSQDCSRVLLLLVNKKIFSFFSLRLLLLLNASLLRDASTITITTHIHFVVKKKKKGYKIAVCARILSLGLIAIITAPDYIFTGAFNYRDLSSSFGFFSFSFFCFS